MHMAAVVIWLLNMLCMGILLRRQMFSAMVYWFLKLWLENDAAVELELMEEIYP